MGASLQVSREYEVRGVPSVPPIRQDQKVLLFVLLALGIVPGLIYGIILSIERSRIPLSNNSFSVPRVDLSQLQNILFPDDSVVVGPFSPRGIGNTGNDCFLNSVLQVLIHSPFASFLQTHLFFDNTETYRQDLNKPNHWLRSFLQSYVKKEASLRSQHLRPIFGMPIEGQQDAHETLIRILSMLSQELQPSLFPLVRVTKELRPDTPVVCNLQRDVEDYDPLSVSKEEFSTVISLPIPGGKGGVSFADCWEGFSRDVSDSNLKFVGSDIEGRPCVQEVEGYVSKYTLINAPDNLFVSLKRFTTTGYDRAGNAIIRKNSASVQVDEYIDIPVDGRQIRYRVKGYISHGGSTNGGHYTCSVSDHIGQWWHLNDSSCSSRRSFNLTEAEKAYIFLLEKVQTQAD